MTAIMSARYRLRRLGIILACAAGGMTAQAADTPLDGVTNAGTITINYLDTGSISSSGTFTNTGTLTLVGALNNAGTYIDSGIGVIFLHGGYASGNAAINNTSSSLMTIANLNVTGSGTLSGTGTYSLGNVTVNPVTSFSIDATTTLTGVMNCNDMLNLLSGRTLNNNGALNCSGTGGWAACYLASGSILNNGGTINISQSTRLSALGTIYLLGTNSGNGVISYSASSDAGSSSINSIITGTGCYGTIAFDSVKDLPITSISVESGATTTITGSGSGTLRVGSATVTGTLNNTRATTITGAFTNNGTVNNSGNLILNSTASYAGSGTLKLNNGTLTNNSSTPITIAALSVSSGAAGVLTGSAATTFSNAQIGGTLNNYATSSFGVLQLASGAVLNNYGTVVIPGGSSSHAYAVTTALTNNYGVFRLSSNSFFYGYTCPFHLLGTNSAEGVLDYSSTATSVPLSTIVTDTGKYGTINLGSTGGLTINALTVESGATTTLTGSGSGALSVGAATIIGTLNNSRATTITGAFTNNGTVNNSGNLILNSTAFYAGSGMLNLNGGTLTNNAATSQTIANLNVSSGNTGTLAGSTATNLTNLTLAGTLNNGNTGGVTVGTLTVASGNTGVLSGTAIPTITNANLSGTLNNNASGTTTINTLTVNSGNTAALGGSSATGVTTANISGTINHVATTANTFGTTYLSGTVNQNSASNLTLTNLNVASGTTGVLGGNGSGALNVGSAIVNGTLINSRTTNITGVLTNNGLLNNSGNLILNGAAAYAGSGTLNLNGGTFTNNAATAQTVANLNIGAGNTGTLAGTTSTAVTNATLSGTLNNSDNSGIAIGILSVTSGSTGTLTGTGSTNVTSANLAGTLNNNASGATTISTLTVSPGNTATLGGSSATPVTTANISGTLNHTATAANTFGTTNLSGTLNQNSASNLTLTNVNIAAGQSGTIGGTGTTNITNANFAGTLNNNSSGAVNIGTLTIASGNSGTIAGSSATSVATANINGTLNHTASTANTLGATNLNGTIRQNSANTLTLTNLNIAAGAAGALEGSGSGSLAVTNAPTINGTLNVNRATAFQSGITALGASGKLSGTGTITGNVTTGGNGGSVAPGGDAATGTLTVIGNVTINLNDTVGLDVINTAADRLATTGNVTLDNGAKIVVTTSGGQVGTTYQVVTASGTLTNSGADVTINSSSAMVDYRYAFTSQDMTVTATQKRSYQSISSGSTTGTAQALDSLSANHPSSMDGMFQAINSMTTTEAVSTAMTELNNANAAASSTQMGMAAIQQSSNALRGQFNSFRTASLATTLSNSTVTAAPAREAIRASAGGVPLDPEAAVAAKRKQLVASLEDTPYYKWEGFLKAYGGFGQEGSSGDSTGYDFGGAGVATGLDYAFSQELRAGWLIDYSYNRSNLYNGLGSATDNILRTGPFGTWNWDNLFIDTAPTCGIHMLETERNINFLNATAKGERTGFDFNWTNTAGYRFDLPKEFMLTPSYGLGFTTMYDPQYTETGATGGANLKINEFTNYSLCQNMDLKLGRLWQISRNLGLLPEIWGGWEHEYLGNGGDVTTAFASAPTQSWTSSVQTIAADRAVFGAGLTTLLCDRWSVFGRYDQKLWQGGFSTNFSAGLRVSF